MPMLQTCPKDKMPHAQIDGRHRRANNTRHANSILAAVIFHMSSLGPLKIQATDTRHMPPHLDWIGRERSAPRSENNATYTRSARINTPRGEGADNEGADNADIIQTMP